MRKLTRAELALVELDLNYQTEMNSTPAGSEACTLLLEAAELEGHGRVDEAMERRRRALALFSEDDEGAAASSARHDLGHALTPNPRRGGLRGRILEDWRASISAMELLRHALRSPARQRVPMRRAQSENSLAVCLRALSGLVEEPKRAELLREVEGLYRSVISLTGKCGALGSRLMAEAHLNYGNLLLDREDDTQALRHYGWAIGAAHRAESEKHGSMRHVVARARLCTAGILSKRGRGKDLKTAEQYAADALREPEPGQEEYALLVLAEIAMRGPGTEAERFERVRTLLGRFRVDQLEDDRLRIDYVRLLRRTGAVNDALAVLRDWIAAAIHARSQTIADFAADTAAMDFQLAASLAARILVEDKQDALGAFLQLENTSGLRFAEAFSVFSWRPREPMTRELQHQLEFHSGLATGLDAVSRTLEPLAPAVQREQLREFLHEIQSLPAGPEKAFYLDVFQAALKAQLPVHEFGRYLEMERLRCLRLKQSLQHHDPSFIERSLPLQEELDRESLEALLREHPEQVLVRLSLHRELLVIATWLEGEQVMARSAAVAVPAELEDLLHEVAEDTRDIDYASLTRLLASVDLSAALPSKRFSRAVLLPSHGASALPLASLGPVGSRLIDRFDSLIWLPCLLPLRTHPAPTRPRSGHVVVNPYNTVFHTLALSSPWEGERRLEGQEATPEAMMQEVSTARTLCLYTHGQHVPGDEPELELCGKQRLPASELGGKVAGLERMEVWACQTGTNRATDPFTPPADEGFGLDFLLLSLGVRTVIGTLWSVPDLVTASIVKHYRQRISEKVDPAVALLEAQRWWQSEGLETLLDQLRQAPPREAVARFSARMGLPVTPATLDSVANMLGPVSRAQEGEKLRALLSCSVSWAALRFVGVPERGPREPWTEVVERPLSEEEQQEVARCLDVSKAAPSGQGSVEAPEDFRELHEAWVRTHTTLTPGETPSSERALEAARLLRDRLVGSFQDNLLVALAWLHEALAAPGLAEADRVRLSVEAAHLWLEVALVEQWPPRVPLSTAVVRAKRLLETLPQTRVASLGDALAARARLSVLLDRPEDEDPLRCLQEAWELLSPALDAPHAEPYEALRLVTIALELLPRSERGMATQRERTVKRARPLAADTLRPLSLMPAWQRLCGALDRFRPDTRTITHAQEFSTPRELWEATLHAVGREAQGPAPSSASMLGVISESLSQLESGLWGYPSDDRMMLVCTTGTLGAAYRELVKAYLSNHIWNQPRSGAHQLACLQYACDLRVTFLGRLAWLSAHLPRQMGAHFKELHQHILHRQVLSTALKDTSLLREGPSDEGPCHLDPYSLPARNLSARVKNFQGLSAWNLDMLCAVWPEPVQPARTAAFEAIRTLSALEQKVRQSWAKALEMDALLRERPEGDMSLKLARMLNPALKLETNEQWLGQLVEGYGLFGLVLGPRDELFIVAWWNAGDGPTGRTIQLSAKDIRLALLELLRPCAEDITPRRGSSGGRREAWRRLEEALAPTFSSLLKEAQSRRQLRWWVLAPGALRALPLLGLRLEGGGLLAEQVVRLSHLPSLGFGPLGGAVPPQGATFTAYVLAKESQQGTTCFGEAALNTLHGTYPPELNVDPEQLHAQGGDLAKFLASQAGQIRTLRLYGVGTPESLNDSTALLRFGDKHALMDRHTLDLFLPYCRTVELWACTAGGIDIERVGRDHEDRLPGLVHGLLASGAATVIDLAWPVHDVIKALVCEQYGWRSRRTGQGAEVLSEAIEHVALLLRELPGLPASITPREVLAAIDHMRQIQAEHVLGRPPHLVPFEAQWNSPAVAGLSGAELIDELCQPVHLGAFRWWGE